MLSAAFDVKSMLWRTSPAATELEEVVLDWLRQMMGLDPGFSGFIEWRKQVHFDGSDQHQKSE